MENNSIEIEYMDIMARSAWPMIYQRIGQLCQEFPYTFIEAKKPQNKPLNRYRDVNPYDHSRVILKRCDRDYINANYVKLDRANRRYILTQGPLAFTVGHFWLMVWEQKSKAILMLNKVIEKNEMKCQWYWPQAIGEQHKIVLNDVNLTVEQTHEEDCSYYSTRTFRLVDLETSTSRVVVQYHYTTWPDFGVPTSPVAFLTFLKRVRQSGVLDSDVGPPIIHCSAGIGRSGTFCLVDSCLVIIEKEGVDNVDIQEILLTLRRDRMGLIQTPDQLRFSYQAIIEGIKRLDPDFKEEEEEEEAEKEPANIDENIYNDVAEEEEAPPPPPPRSESLTRAPAGPLPAIPTSESLGNLDLSRQQEDSSSSDEESPSQSAMESAVSASSTDVEDETYQSPADSLIAGENRETLRRRRTRELAERVSAIKRRAREAERWHALKRSLHKPLTITFGFILAGIIIYSYIKH